jgi:hypothetical protein
MMRADGSFDNMSTGPSIYQQQPQHYSQHYSQQEQNPQYSQQEITNYNSLVASVGAPDLSDKREGFLIFSELKFSTNKFLATNQNHITVTFIFGLMCR